MTTTVADRIKRLRKARGYSQETLANLLHISQSAYARIEAGESQSWATHLERLSEIFEVRPESFFADENNNLEQENTEQKGGMAFQFVGTINTINALSEKLTEQYEERIAELKETIAQLRQEVHRLQGEES